MYKIVNSNIVVDIPDYIARPNRSTRSYHGKRFTNTGSNSEAPAKRSQHANATYRNIVGRNMLCAFGHRVATRCDMLSVVGSSLKMVKFEPTTANLSQHGGQTHATCCAPATLQDVALACCDRLAGA